MHCLRVCTTPMHGTSRDKEFSRHSIADWRFRATNHKGCTVPKRQAEKKEKWNWDERRQLEPFTFTIELVSHSISLWIGNRCFVSPDYCRSFDTIVTSPTRIFHIVHASKSLAPCERVNAVLWRIFLRSIILFDHYSVDENYCSTSFLQNVNSQRIELLVCLIQWSHLIGEWFLEQWSPSYELFVYRSWSVPRGNW